MIEKFIFPATDQFGKPLPAPSICHLKSTNINSISKPQQVASIPPPAPYELIVEYDPKKLTDSENKILDNYRKIAINYEVLSG